MIPTTEKQILQEPTLLEVIPDLGREKKDGISPKRTKK